MRTTRFAALIACCTLLHAGWPVIAAEPGLQWPQWRGPSRDGIVDQQWPQTLSPENLKRKWKVELGPSYSGPIVAADRIFVTETQAKQSEVVRALDRETGEEIWKASWPGAMSVPFFAASNGSWIRATPAYDGEKLYVAGMRDVLVALDARTGAELWRVNFVDQLNSKLPSFGFVSSPLVIGDFVYVQAGGGFVKLNKHTGKIVWRSLADDGGMMGSAFSSPVQADIAGREQLLIQTRTKLAGVDPGDGNVLWSQEIEAFRGMNILTPLAVNDRVFTSAYGGRSLMFQLQKSQSGFEAVPAWDNKAQAYMSSPILIDGHIYLHLRNQRFTCIDAETGETKWTTRPYGKYWSMATNGKQILALDQRGELFLIRPNPEEFTLVARQQLTDQETWAHLAVCGNEIHVRELEAMTVYEWSAD